MACLWQLVDVVTPTGTPSPPFNADKTQSWRRGGTLENTSLRSHCHETFYLLRQLSFSWNRRAFLGEESKNTEFCLDVQTGYNEGAEYERGESGRGEGGRGTKRRERRRGDWVRGQGIPLESPCDLVLSRGMGDCPTSWVTSSRSNRWRVLLVHMRTHWDVRTNNRIPAIDGKA